VFGILVYDHNSIDSGISRKSMKPYLHLRDIWQPVQYATRLVGGWVSWQSCLTQQQKLYCCQSFVRCLAERLGLCPVCVPHVAYIYIKTLTDVNLCAWIRCRVCVHSWQTWHVLNVHIEWRVPVPSHRTELPCMMCVVTCYLMARNNEFWLYTLFVLVVIPYWRTAMGCGQSKIGIIYPRKSKSKGGNKRTGKWYSHCVFFMHFIYVSCYDFFFIFVGMHMVHDKAEAVWCGLRLLLSLRQHFISRLSSCMVQAGNPLRASHY
jgi:hypothetical protein